MQLSPIVEGIRDDLLRAAAVGGDETQRVADVLLASLEASIGLRILDALQAAARELSESAPGTDVEVRLEGRDPVLRLVSPADAAGTGGDEAGDRMAGYAEDDLARLTLRLPEGLKNQVEQLALRTGASINSWIVSTLAHSIDVPVRAQGSRRMPRRISGYVQG